MSGAYYDGDDGRVVTTVSKAIAGAIDAENYTVTVIGTVNDTTDVVLGGVTLVISAGANATLGNIDVQSSNVYTQGTGVLTATLVGQSGIDGSATQSAVEFRAPLRDTLIRHLSYAPVCDTSRVGASLAAWPVRTFRWRDTWVSVEGRIVNDSVVCRVESVDTLRQVIHRVPRRFLFFRFGTKAVRQEIVSSNPHTRIVYAEYVRFDH